MNKQGIKLSERHLLRKDKWRRMSETDHIIAEIRGSYLDSSCVSKEMADELQGTFSIHLGDEHRQADREVAIISLRGGRTIVVCSVEKIAEGLIRVHIVDEKTPHAVIRVEEIATIQGNLYG